VTEDISPTTPNPAAAKPKRRFWQFRLRTALAASVVFALALGWQVNRAARQRQAVAAVRALGGHVYYEQDLRGGDEDAGFGGRAPAWIGDRFGRDFVDRVVWVDLDGTEVGNDDLRHIEALGTLELLRISGGQISGDGLARLASLGDLEVLSLENHRHVADGLIHLRGLRRLRSIVLRGTDAADEHIDAVCRLDYLENIDLVNTRIGDDALDRLAELPNLTNLQILGTGVTESGVSAFRQRRPDVRVEY
jgi:hypothetical protein